LGIVTSSHLSSFGVAYLNTDPVKVKDYPGIGTEREAPLDHPPIKKSKGVFYLTSLLTLFTIGTLFLFTLP
jgi:hypothetical protein